MNCFACQEIITNQLEILTCSSCNSVYHYECLGMADKYYNEHKENLSRGWRCTPCNNITTRRRNNNTPVRKQFDTTSFLEDTNVSIDVPLDQESQQNSSVHHDKHSSYSQQDQSITIEQIGSLLDSKLSRNNSTILSNIKHLIQEEINTAVQQLKTEFLQKNYAIILQQQAFEKQLEATNLLIKNLQSENETIKMELNHIKAHCNNIQVPNANSHCNEKQFVLYGLDEYYGETEMDLYPRIDNMFKALLNININGFIETARRVGKKGTRRPVVLELISKRMTKFVLQNACCFRSTGYAVSEVLDQAALKKRKNLRECLISARKEGNHATIRNNKLFINGKEYTPEYTPPTQPQQHTQPTQPIGKNNSSIRKSPQRAPSSKENLRHQSTSTSAIQSPPASGTLFREQ